MTPGSSTVQFERLRTRSLHSRCPVQFIRGDRELAGPEAVAFDNGLEQFRLFSVARDRRFEHPEQFEQFGGEFTGPPFGADVVEWRGLPARSFLQAVLDRKSVV